MGQPQAAPQAHDHPGGPGGVATRPVPARKLRCCVGTGFRVTLSDWLQRPSGIPEAAAGRGSADYDHCPGRPEIRGFRPVPVPWRVWRLVLPPRQRQLRRQTRQRSGPAVRSAHGPQVARRSRRAHPAAGRRRTAAALAGARGRRAWLGIAHVVGAGVRRIGHDVSDLARGGPPRRRRPVQPRCCGVFIATFAWWGLTGLVPGRGLRRRQRHLRLDGRCVLPLMLFVCAFRAVPPARRRPRQQPGRHRLPDHDLRRLRPGPRDRRPADRRRRLRRPAPAGGMLGFLAAAPLAAIQRRGCPWRLYGLLAFISAADRHRHALPRHPAAGCATPTST